MKTNSKRLQMSSCLWPMESYDFTVFDFKSITWNNGKAMVNKQTNMQHFARKKKSNYFTVITHKKVQYLAKIL